MTPGYGFAYFRWRTLDYKFTTWDETGKAIFWSYWRLYDQKLFASLQSKP